MLGGVEVDADVRRLGVLGCGVDDSGEVGWGVVVRGWLPCATDVRITK